MGFPAKSPGFPRSFGSSAVSPWLQSPGPVLVRRWPCHTGRLAADAASAAAGVDDVAGIGDFKCGCDRQ